MSTPPDLREPPPPPLMGHGLPAGQRLLDLALPRGRDLDPARSQCPPGLTGGVWWVSPADCAQWCRLGSRRTDPPAGVWTVAPSQGSTRPGAPRASPSPRSRLELAWPGPESRRRGAARAV
ncbi:hypothetical protein KIL84_002015 [Mauremys mutica]|uniref:Uncharacterized protein n=1 Tax=Mauremys mutica TaxID=74926 RepID=A0A9D4B595_9SAUR|nr:hypothetical protein KIL84_002015 [Mauremys mutica]